jgi:sugar lactone lactonase YvrE
MPLRPVAAFSVGAFALASVVEVRRALSTHLGRRARKSHRPAVSLTSGVALLAAIFLVAAPANAQTEAYLGQPLGGEFSYPTGVAVDVSGKVYVTSGTSISRFPAGCASSSCVSTLIGGFTAPSYMRIDGAGNLYVVDNQATLYRFAAGCTAIGCATTVGGGYSSIAGLALSDTGKVYVADVNSPTSYVKEMTSSCASAKCVTTLVSGSSPFYAGGVAVDGSGNIYVANQSPGAVYEIQPGCSDASCFITLGGGFNNPNDVAVDSYGDVYVLDSGGGSSGVVYEMPSGCASSSCVTRIGAGYVLPTIVGEFTVDANRNVYIADQYNFKVEEIEQQAVSLPATKLGSSVTQTVTFTVYSSGKLGTPAVLTQGATGKDFTDTGTGTCTTNGASYTYAQNGDETCTVNVKFSPQFAGQRYGAVQLVDSTGTVVLATAYLTATATGPTAVFPGNTATANLGGGFDSPFGIAVDGAGNVYTSDDNTSVVSEILATDGVVSSTSAAVRIGTGFLNPTGLAVDGAGNVFVADTGNNAIKEILAVNGTPSANSIVISVGSGFNGPQGVAVDAAGNVYVADAGNSSVKEIVAMGGAVSPNSSVATLGSGFSIPISVAVDAAGNVFVADTTRRAGSALKEIVAVGGVASSTSAVVTFFSSNNRHWNFPGQPQVQPGKPPAHHHLHRHWTSHGWIHRLRPPLFAHRQRVAVPRLHLHRLRNHSRARGDDQPHSRLNPSWPHGHLHLDPRHQRRRMADRHWNFPGQPQVQPGKPPIHHHLHRHRTSHRRIHRVRPPLFENRQRVAVPRLHLHRI